MKRIFCLLMALVIALALCSCDNKGNDNSGENPIIPGAGGAVDTPYIDLE